MSLFGYDESDLAAARRQGEREGERRVWKMWCRRNLIRGQKPPMFCPNDVIDEVRADLHRERAGL